MHLHIAAPLLYVCHSRGCSRTKGAQLNRETGVQRDDVPLAGIPKGQRPLGQLQLIQLLVDAVLLQQLLMGAAFADLAVVHDDDAVAVLDGG